jgi:ABC-type nitrate/sulfonate/bicarbonate transport system ATPase subunit/ABC-type nitrate/sulfonate/bicarbonate transport system permease component
VRKRPRAARPWAAAGVACILLVWKGASLVTAQSLLLPPPEEVFLTLARLAASPRFLRALLATFARLVLTLAAAIPLGIAAGLAAGLSARARAFLAPFFSIVAATPVMSIILIAFLWFGSERTPSFAAFLMVFPVITANVMEGIRALDPKLKELFTVYNMDARERLRHLYLPSLAPFIAGGCRASLSMCWKVVVAAEVLVQPLAALGTGMQRAKAALDTTELFAWTAAAVIAASLSEAALRLLPSSGVAAHKGKHPRRRIRGIGGERVTPARPPAAAKASVALRGLSFSFGEKKIIDALSLELCESPAVMLGPSGCGKTTLLRLIAGLLQGQSGEVLFEGERAGAISFVFQEPRLLPRLTALENIMLPSRKHFADAELIQRANRLLALTGLQSAEGRYPGELSGGQAQRVSIARAFCYPAPLLLMDEPFQSLDLPLRLSLLETLKTLLAAETRFVIAVTHDPREAVIMGRRVLVMGREGRIALDELNGKRSPSALEHAVIAALRQG